MQKEEIKTIYIYMDDSGRMSHSDKCCSYGGIYFTDRFCRDNFKRHYLDIINENKCQFCDQNNINCNQLCPEIKSHSTNQKFRRRILNLIKNSTYANSYITTIYTRDIPSNVLNIKSSRGRRVDYYQKRIIKEIVKYLIKKGEINPYKKLKLVIRIDQSTTSTDGKYGLQESIIEELMYGITNFDYGCTFPPILYGGLMVDLKYVDSKKEPLVQAADFFVGYANATLMWKPKREKLNFADIQLYF